MTPRRKQNHNQPVGEQVSIYLRGRTWCANYQQDGRQIRISLKTKIKKEALNRAGKLERDLLNGISPQRMAKMSFAQVEAEFLESAKIHGRATATISHYKTVLRKVGEFLIGQGVRWISQIDLQQVEAFRASLQALNRRPKTVTFYLNVIRSLVLFAYRHRYLDSDPLVNLRIGKAKARPQPFWTWDQVQQILGTAPEEHRPLFTFLAYTGTRIGEAIHLEWSDVDFANGIIRIREKEGWTTKSREDRAIPMCNELRGLFASLPRQHPLVFVRPLSVRKNPRNAKTRPKVAMIVLRGVLTPLNLPGRLHTFRHAFISHALTRGVPESVVREWVGHVDSGIIRLYTHIAGSVSKSQMTGLFDGGSRTAPEN